MQYAVGWNQRVSLDRQWLNKIEATSAVHDTTRSFRVIPALFLFAVLILQLHVRLTIVDRAYQIEILRDSFMQKQDLIRELKLSVESASDPDLIMQTAKSKLGLGLTPPQRIRKISVK